MNTRQALERLTKWRSFFAGWQLGTRLDTDPECNAVRNHRELSMLLRVEASALAGLLIEKGVFTQEEWEEAVGKEAEQLNQDYAAAYPGIEATDEGMAYLLPQAMETMRRMHFKA